MKIIETEIATIPAKYDRTAIIKFVGTDLVFDTSNEEYGPCSIDIDDLLRAFAQHLNKLLK